MYDCTDDVMEHKRKIEYWMRDIAGQITGRARVHDDSKLKEPEKAIFDEWTPNLDRVEFGSEEYHEALEAMGQGLAHHYHSNRHHPEHFRDGIGGMTLIDLIEMFCDWLAAAEKQKTHIDLDYLQQRFSLSDQLVKVFYNTLEDIDFWSRVHNAPVPQFTPPLERPNTITPEKLESIGCRKIHWNPNYNGGFFEYYLPIHGDGVSWESTRLSVTFNGFEKPEYGYLAWIVSPSHRLGLPHVRTIVQFVQMHELLVGHSLTRVSRPEEKKHSRPPCCPVEAS